MNLKSVLTIPLVLTTCLVLYGIYLEVEVRLWDRRIDALCMKNGGKDVGIRVYEQIEAPLSYLEGSSPGLPGQVIVPHESRAISAPIIQRHLDLELLNPSQPKVVRYSLQIVRRSDQAVLGEEIGYMRTGGGIPMPDPGDFHLCPPLELTSYNTSKLLSEVFTNNPIKE